VVQGGHRAPAPVGNVTRVGPSPEAMQVLLDASSLGTMRHTVNGTEATTILVYRARDVDVANHTVRLHLVSLNATALAAANLTESVKSAAAIPGVGLLLQVPEDTVLPEIDNGTATLSVQEPVVAHAETNATSAPDAAAIQPIQLVFSDAGTTFAARDASQGAPATVRTAGDRGATDGLPGVPADSGVIDATPVEIVGPVSATGDGSAAQGSAASGGLAQPQSAPAPATDAASPPARASIPLVSLLAAALMVSIYLPNRRQP
ncbi:MAG: hypothetical protein LC620_03700, partial [Halobacteriales archaeon]|nr:hypothetical protein [Halobacteriales archaeon]